MARARYGTCEPRRNSQPKNCWPRANRRFSSSRGCFATASAATCIGQFSFRNRVADPFAEPELLTVAAAFECFVGIDLLGTVAEGKGDRDALAAMASARVRISDDDSWS